MEYVEGRGRRHSSLPHSAAMSHGKVDTASIGTAHRAEKGFGDPVSASCRHSGEVEIGNNWPRRIGGRPPRLLFALVVSRIQTLPPRIACLVHAVGP